MNNGRILQQAMAAQQPQMVLATPINDIQLVALVAAKCDGTPKERVSLAMDLVAEAITQMNAGGMKSRLDALKEGGQ